MPKEAYGVGAVAGALLTLVCLVNYAGPYRLVADLQVAWFGTNIINISFWVTMAVVSAPILGVLYLIERRIGTRATWFTPVWDNLDRITDLWPGKLLMVGATLVVMELFFGVKDLGRGPLTSVSVRDLEAGNAPESTFVVLDDGVVLRDANIRFTSGSLTYRYVPVVARASRPAVFLRLPEDDRVPDSAEGVRGLLDRDAMEGELVSQLQDADSIGSPHFVLGVGREPDPAFGGWMALIGLMACVGGLLWWRVSYAPGSIAAPSQS